MKADALPHGWESRPLKQDSDFRFQKMLMLVVFNPTELLAVGLGSQKLEPDAAQVNVSFQGET